jgi:hypothetical protein
MTRSAHVEVEGTVVEMRHVRVGNRDVIDVIVAQDDGGQFRPELVKIRCWTPEVLRDLATGQHAVLRNVMLRSQRRRSKNGEPGVAISADIF